MAAFLFPFLICYMMLMDDWAKVGVSSYNFRVVLEYVYNVEAHPGTKQPITALCFEGSLSVIRNSGGYLMHGEMK